MKYFKDEHGQVFAYDDEQVDQGYGVDMAAMTDAEVDAHLNPAKTLEQLQEQINTEAREYLAETDWYVIRAQETGVEVPADILEARQAARDSIV